MPELWRTRCRRFPVKEPGIFLRMAPFQAIEVLVLKDFKFAQRYTGVLPPNLFMRSLLPDVNLT
jgi:hypothetical protein